MAGGLLLLWLVSLIGLLRIELLALPLWLLVLLVLLRTALQTGLFIAAHDAMHGLLLRGNPVWNRRCGAGLLLLYAGLSYRRCLRQHQRHHQYSGGDRDPDAPLDASVGIWGWYLGFMSRYLTTAQMVRLLSFWMVLALLAAGWCQILVLCVLPLWLSSLQLFVFGTYLPHRRQQGQAGWQGPETIAFPEWLSLLACFHFGYHCEHHERPHLAWFELPAEHRRRRLLA